TQRLMDTTSSLYVCLLLFTSWVDPSHQIIVFAKQGSTAILPCKLSDLSNQTLTVSWRTIKNKVFERTNNQTYQGKAHKGRVNIPEDELIKGNCSLVLKHVKLSDSARYYSYLMKADRNDPINTVQLSVEAEETPEKRRNERVATL
ncbi:CD276 antigen, partial [Clarias magur]